MNTFEFQLHFQLPNSEADPETWLDPLFEAGCDDALIGLATQGYLSFDFSREASTAWEALQTAVQDVKKAMPEAQLRSSMATTSMSLGPYWERFIKEQIANGRYGSASEVVRDALRVLETRQAELAALRAHLAEGEEQAEQGQYVDSFSMDELIRDLDVTSGH